MICIARRTRAYCFFELNAIVHSAFLFYFLGNVQMLKFMNNIFLDTLNFLERNNILWINKMADSEWALYVKNNANKHEL